MNRKCFLMALFMGAALAAWGQSLQFVDKDGHTVADGSEIHIKDYEKDLWDNILLKTGLYVKNTSSEAVTLAVEYQVESMSNGSFQICFPVNCTANEKTGSYETLKGSIPAGTTKDLQAEWVPQEEGAWGTCKAILLLKTYRDNGDGSYTFIENGPKVTVTFSYQDSATASQTWWGYYLNGNRTAIGEQSNTTYDQAIYIPGTHPSAVGKKVKAVRVYLRSKSRLTNLKVWLSKSLPESVDNADRVVNVPRADYTGKDDNSSHYGTANDIVLESPYEVTSDGVYVGYSFDITRLGDDADRYPVVTYNGDHNENALFMRTASPDTGWKNNSQRGTLALQVLLEGDFKANAVSPEDFGNFTVGLGKSANVHVVLNNEGTEGIHDLDFTLTASGVTSGEYHYEMVSPFTTLGAVNVRIPIPAAEQTGTQELMLRITKVNGQPNESDTPTATGTMTTVDEHFKRVVLFEEFTTEQCPSCPPIAEAISKVEEDPAYDDVIAVVSYHSGYNTDRYTTDTDKAYLWFYNNNGSTYAPAMMFDRYAGDNTSTAGWPTPVKYEGTASSMKGEIDRRLAVETPVSINLSAIFNEARNRLDVHADGLRKHSFGETSPRITFVLTEDNLDSKTQAGAESVFTHQHVARLVSERWGTVLEWQDDRYSYDYQFQLNPDWKTADLKVVAFISDYAADSPAGCTVANAAVTTPVAYSLAGIQQAGIDEIIEVARYRLDGTVLSKPERGINLVKMSNGVVKKVIVR